MAFALFKNIKATSKQAKFTEAIKAIASDWTAQQNALSELENTHGPRATEEALQVYLDNPGDEHAAAALLNAGSAASSIIDIVKKGRAFASVRKDESLTKLLPLALEVCEQLEDAIQKRAQEAVKQARKMADIDGLEFDEEAVLRPYNREIAGLPNSGDTRHDGGKAFVNSLAGKLGVSPTDSEVAASPAGEQPETRKGTPGVVTPMS